METSAVSGFTSFLITCWGHKLYIAMRLDEWCSSNNSFWFHFFLLHYFYYFLQCSDGCDPNDDKFLFKVDKVDRRTQNSKYSTIQSAKTEQFLISDESGNASMKEITDHTDGPTSDRQAWFQFIPDQRRYSLSWQN